MYWSEIYGSRNGWGPCTKLTFGIAYVRQRRCSTNVYTISKQKMAAGMFKTYKNLNFVYRIVQIELIENESSHFLLTSDS